MWIASRKFMRKFVRFYIILYSIGNMRRYIMPLATMALMLCSCGESGFKVSGNVEGGSDTTKMVL